MKKIKKIIEIMILSIMPICLYEIALCLFWLFVVPYENIAHIHQIGYSFDLIILIIILSFGYLIGAIWNELRGRETRKPY